MTPEHLESLKARRAQLVDKAKRVQAKLKAAEEDIVKCEQAIAAEKKKPAPK